MSLTGYTPTLKGSLNRASQGLLGALLAYIGFGDIIRQTRVALRGKDPDAAGANKYVAVAAESITLPDDAKASVILKAWARTGTGTKGALTPGAADLETEPGGTAIDISPSGDLIFHGADAYTSVDVEYLPEIADVVEVTMSATAADTFTLPTQFAGKVIRLIEAESLTGTLVSKMLVFNPVDAKPATTKAALVLSKLAVQFAVADAVTSARLKLLVSKSLDVNARLEAASVTL